MQKKLLAIALGSMFALPVLAADAPAAAPAVPAVPTLSAILDASGIAVTGYVDFGYTNINSTGLLNGSAKITAPSRVFDAPNATVGKNFSSFNLNQAAITVSKAPKEGFGGLINLTAGQDAGELYSTGEGSATSNFDVTQAYGSYTGGALTVIAGKFATLAGAEVIPGPSNTNISRSMLFAAVPLTHTGVRATDAVSDTFSVIAGVNNGWDQVTDQNTEKTLELGFNATPNKLFSLAGVYYGGKELAGGYQSLTYNGNRQLIDLVATVNATESLTFIVNYDHATQDTSASNKATWGGLAGYVNYQFSPKCRASLRSEFLDDKDGLRLPNTGLGQKLKETTLTLAYLPAPSFELRGEVREDSSNQSVFLNSDGKSKTNQSSLGLEAIYKF